MANVDSITKENFRVLLAAFIDENDLQVKKVAKTIPCREESMNRLIGGITRPTDDMVKQAGILFSLGFKTYSKLKASEKEKMSASLGAIGAGGLGFASLPVIIGASGTVTGLAGPGIVAGLYALGTLVGGGMVAGLAVTAAIPIATGGAGYGIFKGVKALIEQRKLHSTGFDPKWEELTLEVIPERDPSTIEGSQYETI